MDCPNCNAPCKETDQFCTNCGFALSEISVQMECELEPGLTTTTERAGEVSPVHPALHPNQKMRLVLVLAGVVLLVFSLLLPRLLEGPVESKKTPQELAQDYFTHAKSEYVLENYAETLKLLELAIREDPNLQDAISLREKVIPLRVNDFLWAAKEAQERGDYQTACKRAQEALSLDYACAEAASLLAELEPLLEQQQADAEAAEQAASAPGATAPVIVSPTQAPQEAQPVDVWGTMDKASKRNVNVFLSNFSEQDFKFFDATSYSEAQLIDFAYFQNIENNRDAFYYDDHADDGNNYYLSEQQIDRTIERFFGLSVTHQSTDRLVYSGGEYGWDGSFGLAVLTVTIVDTMYQSPNGTYTANFTIYECYDYEDVDAVYGYTASQIQGDNAYSPVATGTAVFKDTTYNGKASYHLTQYSTIALSEGADGNGASAAGTTSIVFDSKGRFEEYGLSDENGNAIFPCGIIIADFEIDESDPFQVPWCRGVVYNDTGMELMGMELNLVGLDEAGREVERDGTTLHIDVDSSAEFDFTLMWLDSKMESISSVLWKITLHDYSY